MYPLISQWRIYPPKYKSLLKIAKRCASLLLISIICLVGVASLTISPSYAQVINSREAGHPPKDFKSTPQGAPLDTENRLGSPDLHSYDKPTTLQKETEELDYEELGEQAKNPRVLKKQYQEDLESYRENHSDEGVIDKAKALLEK